jgi:hypothetical protein
MSMGTGWGTGGSGQAHPEHHMTPLELNSRRRALMKLMSEHKAVAEPPHVEIHVEPRMETRPTQPAPAANAAAAAVAAPGPAGPAGAGGAGSPDFPDVLDFGHMAFFGGVAPPHLRLLWQSRGWSATNGADVFKHLSDQHEIGTGTDIWTELGITALIMQDPGKWLKLDVIVFVVGVYHKITNRLPSAHAVIGMLEIISQNTITPAVFIRSVAHDFKASPDVLQALLASYPDRSRKIRWPWAKSTGMQFEQSRVTQSMMTLRLARHLGRIGWGALPFEMLYKGSDYMQQTFR